MENKYKADVLALAAHPDDIELGCGATVAKLCKEGKTVAIVDFTRGEMGTRGTPEIRVKEAEEAAAIMGVKYRENLCLPDCNLKVDDKSVKLVVQVIRKYRPNTVLMNPPFERHPDHEASNAIIRNAMFKSGLRNYVTELDGEKQEIHRIRKMFCYQQAYDFDRKTDFYVDVSDTFHIKMEAIKAYISQVYVPGKSDPKGPVTRLSRPEFLEELEARAIANGMLVGCRFAEGFQSTEPIMLSSLSKLL